MMTLFICVIGLVLGLRLGLGLGLGLGLELGPCWGLTCPRDDLCGDKMSK